MTTTSLSHRLPSCKPPACSVIPTENSEEPLFPALLFRLIRRLHRPFRVLPHFGESLPLLGSKSEGATFKAAANATISTSVTGLVPVSILTIWVRVRVTPYFAMRPQRSSCVMRGRASLRSSRSREPIKLRTGLVATFLIVCFRPATRPSSVAGNLGFSCWRRVRDQRRIRDFKGQADALVLGPVNRKGAEKRARHDVVLLPRDLLNLVKTLADVISDAKIQLQRLFRYHAAVFVTETRGRRVGNDLLTLSQIVTFCLRCSNFLTFSLPFYQHLAASSPSSLRDFPSTASIPPHS